MLFTLHPVLLLPLLSLYVFLFFRSPFPIFLASLHVPISRLTLLLPFRFLLLPIYDAFRPAHARLDALTSGNLRVSSFSAFSPNVERPGTLYTSNAFSFSRGYFFMPRRFLHVIRPISCSDIRPAMFLPSPCIVIVKSKDSRELIKIVKDIAASTQRSHSSPTGYLIPLPLPLLSLPLLSRLLQHLRNQLLHILPPISSCPLCVLHTLFDQRPRFLLLVGFDPPDVLWL